MQLIKDEKYQKREMKFFKRHQNLIGKYEEVLKILKENHTDKSLRLHPLKGKLQGFHSVRLTYEYRIVLILIIEKNQIVLVDIGTHDAVYQYQLKYDFWDKL